MNLHIAILKSLADKCLPAVRHSSLAISKILLLAGNELLHALFGRVRGVNKSLNVIAVASEVVY